jgi:hypothetical protein
MGQEKQQVATRNETRLATIRCYRNCSVMRVMAVTRHRDNGYSALSRQSPILRAVGEVHNAKR